MDQPPKTRIISIVDDDVVAREGAADLINALGFTTTTFASAEEFLQSVKAEDTSCLITDLQMPGLSGLELQSHLLAVGRKIPVIFITAFPQESVRRRALSAGAIAFLSKPFQEAALVQSLEVALKVKVRI